MTRTEDGRGAGPWRTSLAAALIVICGLAAYSNSFTGLFAGLDGKQSIRDNPHIRQLWPLSEALSLPMCGSVEVPEEHPTVACRPVFSLLLALTHHFFGLAPRAYHGVNLAIHIAAALVLFGIVRRTVRRRHFDGLEQPTSTWFALAIALIWLLHPLQTESVTYTVQISETLMGLMLLLMMYCAVRSLDFEFPLWWQAGAVAACALSIGSKQSAIVAPFLVLLYDHTFISKSAGERYRPKFYLALAVPVVVSLLSVLGGVQQAFDAQKTLAYVLAQPGVIVHYLRLSLWPDELYLYVNTSLFAVHSAIEVLLPGLLLSALLLATLWGVAGRRWYGFVGGWFFLTLAPTSSLIAINDRIQEHRMYMPLAALAVLTVAGGYAALRAVSTPRVSTRGRAAVGAGLVLVVLLGLGARTYVRNWDYHHEFTMIHPADLPEAYMILAQHHLSLEHLDGAADEARQVLASGSADSSDVVYAHFISGFHAERQGDLETAADHFHRAVELQPDFVYSRRALASTLVRLGRLEEAAAECESALQTRPSFPEAHYELGMILMQQDEEQRAIEHFRRAIELWPGFAEAHYELGLALQEKDTGAAVEHLRRAIEIEPDLVEARELLETLEERGLPQRLSQNHGPTLPTSRGYTQVPCCPPGFEGGWEDGDSRGA